METSTSGYSYSPVQVVDSPMGKYLFYISVGSGDLLCERITYETDSSVSTERLMSVCPGPIRGFSAMMDDTGAMFCYVQNTEGKLLRMMSQNAGMTWRSLGEM